MTADQIRERIEWIEHLPRVVADTMLRQLDALRAELARIEGRSSQQ